MLQAAVSFFRTRDGVFNGRFYLVTLFPVLAAQQSSDTLISLNTFKINFDVPSITILLMWRLYQRRLK